MNEPLYRLIDINESVGNEEIVSIETLDGLKEFLYSIWANHTPGDGEDFEMPDYEGLGIEQLQDSLIGVGYYAEEIEPNEKENIK